MFVKNYADVFKGDERWRNLPTPSGNTFEWAADSTYVRKPPYFEGMPADPEPVSDISGARVLALLGDSVTTDHISPAGSIKPGTPAAQYLDEHGVERKDYNSYGSRRGNHEVMIRGTFANIRLRNLLLDDSLGRLHPRLHPGRRRRRSSTTRRKTMRHKTFRWWCSAARSTAPVRRGTGRPRAPAAGCAGGDRRVVRAHPPVQPDRHGRDPAAVPGGQVGRSRWGWTAPRSSTSPASRHSTTARRRRRCTSKPAKEDGGRRAMSISTRWCASTPPVKPTTTATAASCSTCCATCSGRS